MRYFPLESGEFEHQFGVRALPSDESLVETTSHYDVEIAQRRELLARNCEYYFQATVDSVDAQREAAELVIESSDALSPEQNLRTGEPLDLDNESPLRSIGRHVQEDLTILRADSAGGFPLIAGSVCFPSGWCIGDKIGKSTLDVHDPVPEFAAELGPPTLHLMQRLKAGRPVWRTNWGVRPSSQLDQSPRHAERLNQQTAEITASNAGERCFFRVERQTLVRLGRTGDILFAIHTHQCSLRDLPRHQQSSLLGVLDTCPPRTLAYKGILPMSDAIRTYLRSATG